MTELDKADKTDKSDKAEEQPPLQWFRASFAGEYFGIPNPDAPKAQGRRLGLNVYRVEAREVVLIDAPGDEEAGSEPADSWQARIDEAHLPHVLGPGTAYRGPVFDVQLRQIQLSLPIEHKGRAYGRIEGSLLGAFVMPKKPVIPVVKVKQKVTRSPAPDKPLEATLSLTDPTPKRTPPSPSPMADEIVHTPSPSLRGLAAFMLVVGVALGVQSGWGYAAFWALCALPMLPLRWMFHELFRPSRLVNATAFVAALGSIACAAWIVHAFRVCAPLPWWPAVVTLVLLVPVAPMPSSLPTVNGLLCLALIVGLVSARNHHAPCVTSHAQTVRVSSILLCETGAGGQIEPCVSDDSSAPPFLL